MIKGLPSVFHAIVHDDIEKYPFFLLIDVEPMYLEHTVMLHNRMCDLRAQSIYLIIGGVHGIYPYACHDHTVLCKYPIGYISLQFIYLCCRHGVRDLHMYGCHISVRPIIMHDQVVGSHNLRFLTNCLFNL